MYLEIILLQIGLRMWSELIRGSGKVGDVRTGGCLRERGQGPCSCIRSARAGVGGRGGCQVLLAIYF